MFSPTDNYIIINYHYIEDPSPKWRGIHPCPVAEFERQTKFLAENYQVVAIEELVKAAQENRPGRFAAITFDDGLKSQYQNAFPVLKKYGLTATFFIITSTLERRLPAAHRTHILLSHFETIKLINLFHRYLDEFYPDLATQHAVPLDRRLTNRRLHEDTATANLKETLIVLPEDIKAQFLRYCFKNLRLDARSFAQQFFMSREEIQELARAGMTIGSHTHNHYSLEAVSPAIFQKDLTLAKQMLAEITGSAPIIFSYPHGRANKRVAEVLKEESFRYAVTIEGRGVKMGDNPLALPRYDTNDVKNFLM